MKTTKDRTPKANRKPYTTPRLVRYGDVGLLTRTGTFIGTESGGMMMNMTPSSRAVKHNIVRVGEHPAGFGLYLFDYRPEFRDRYGRGRQFGVIAEEVQAVLPEAVSEGPEGHKLVDYALLGIRQHRA